MPLPPKALRRRAHLVAIAAAIAVGATGTGSAGADSGSCTRVAAPGGSDHAAGTEAAPFATAQKLVDSLGAGDTGCLRQGSYHEDVTIDRGGNGEDSRVDVRSYPGERATIAGRLYVTDDADYVTVEQLDLNGHDSGTCGSDCVLPSPTVNGDHITFQDNDVTNDHRGICFNLGNHGYGRAVDDTIQRNRIHDCGTLPADNHEHGIYLTWTENTQVLGNFIYDNADRGIQLYPDAQHTRIAGNVIDGNGEGVIFSGAGDTASNDNVLENNVITNSHLRHDVEYWYPNLIGQRNVVRNNCVYGGAQGEIAKGSGYSVSSNLIADPKYVDRSGKDFRLSAGSPCAGVLDGAQLPSSPDSSSKQSSDGTSGTGKVVVSRATLRHSGRHHRRWRLRIDGRVRGPRGPHRAIVQIRRGGSWQRLAVRQIRHRFSVSVDARIPGSVHGARVTRARVVIPGVAKSRSVPVSVRG